MWHLLILATIFGLSFPIWKCDEPRMFLVFFSVCVLDHVWLRKAVTTIIRYECVQCVFFIPIYLSVYSCFHQRDSSKRLERKEAPLLLQSCSHHFYHSIVNKQPSVVDVAKKCPLNGRERKLNANLGLPLFLIKYFRISVCVCMNVCMACTIPVKKGLPRSSG